MTEWKLFATEVPHVSTHEYHVGRERAAHLEQADHQLRLATAADFIIRAAQGGTFSDLGCGDGGLLSVVQHVFTSAWGYDFHEPNAEGWKERGVTGYLKDVFNGDRAEIRLGTVVACTEVLEHVADPHGVVKWLYDSPEVHTLVCSSPQNENDTTHSDCHAWAWDNAGYAELVTSAGWTIQEHKSAGPYQVIRAYK